MPERDVNQIAHKMEHAPTSSDGHTHNFEDAYRSIAQMQARDGGANSAQFHQDMASLNQKLMADGTLPNLQISGIDDHNHIITKDRADGQTTVQDASHVNDFGAPHNNTPHDGAPHDGAPPESAREERDMLLAHAFGIPVTKNPDGSFNVTNPLDDPNAADKILTTVFDGLMNFGGSGNSSGDGSNGEQSSTPFGMNPLMAQAWKGWDDPPADDTPDEG